MKRNAIGSLSVLFSVVVTTVLLISCVTTTQISQPSKQKSLSYGLLGIAWESPPDPFPDHFPDGKFSERKKSFTVKVQSFYEKEAEQITFGFSQNGFTSALLFFSKSDALYSIEKELVEKNGLQELGITHKNNSMRTVWYGNQDIQFGFAHKQYLLIALYKSDPEF